MDAIDVVITRMRQNGDAPVLFWQGREISYADFLSRIEVWLERLKAQQIGPGTLCGILGDYSPEVCSLIFALMLSKAIIVPFSYAVEPEIPGFLELAGVQKLFRFNSEDKWTVEDLPEPRQNDLVASFLERGSPGLIVFTSGSTGKPKGILHDCERVMRKFVSERPGWRTVLFLMIDHFGGFNTLLSTFAYGGAGVCVPQRTPEAVCRAIEQSRATLLPTTPTFLNLLMAFGSYKAFDLSSIKLITYGTEVMSEATLQRVQTMFPGAQIKQTYGLSELGVLRSRSEGNDSVWVKVGGEGFEVRVVDNILWVRSEANMVGYLNAPNPFDAEGWMSTGDQVEVRGEYIRFLGRKSEIINVGGQKVFPVEVETVLLQAENIREATAYGVKHPLMGQAVHARVSLYEPEDPVALNERLRKFCLDRLARYKMPTRFVIVSEEDQRSERYKKIRRGNEGEKEAP
jgi:acyl-CoA synthetase (AMP-forming)/AMP-acid ligase II